MNLRTIVIAMSLGLLINGPVLAQELSQEILLIADNGSIADPAAVHVKEGEKFARDNDWVSARQEFIQATAANPKSAAAFYDLAIACARLNALMEAKEAVNKALAVDSSFVQAYIELGWILSKQENWLAAEDAYKQALKLAPENHIAAESLRSLQILKKPVEEKDLFERATELFKMGRINEAQGILSSLLNVNPSSSRAHSDLGVVLGAGGNYDQEILEEKKAIKIDPRNSSAYTNLGWAYAKKQLWKDALDSYRKALQISPDLMQAQIGQAISVFHTGLPEAGIAILQDLSKRKANESGPYVALGLLRQEQGRMNEALAALDKAVKVAPSSVEAKKSLAFLRLNKGNTKQAKALYMQIKKSYPQEAEAYIGLGLALGKLSQADQAISEFKKAIEIEPQNAAAHAGLSYALALKGDHEEAEKEALTALDIDEKIKIAGNSGSLPSK